jgi:hypothetical protein
MKFLTLYILLCLICGVLGRNARTGFWGVFVLSMVITPVFSLLMILFYGRSDDIKNIEKT